MSTDSRKSLREVGGERSEMEATLQEGGVSSEAAASGIDESDQSTFSVFPVTRVGADRPISLPKFFCARQVLTTEGYSDEFLRLS
jgi:hypothetical protein